MEGRIHSVESFGTVDGPGIRFVIFLQGCPLRCRYCHNPDTWNTKGGQRISCEQLLEQFNKNKMFYKRGGITVTGGEPLLQVDFVTELFTLAKAQGIHTCIDTSGGTYREGNAAYIQKLDALMAVTDLVMLDLKVMDPAKHKDLTEFDNQGILAFARYLDKKKIPLWVRHVVIPGITDDPKDLRTMGEFMGSLSNVKALDVLPYHTLGVKKYEELGLTYSLSGIKPATKADADAAKQVILEGYRSVHSR